MKKTNQNNSDFEMINLDETAGWNQLEIEEALAESTYTEESLVFQGEITLSEEDLYDIGQVEPVGIAEEVDSLGSVEEIMAYAQSACSNSMQLSPSWFLSWHWHCLCLTPSLPSAAAF